MYDAGRPDQRKRPGSLWLNYSRAIRRREIFGLLGPVICPAFLPGHLRQRDLVRLKWAGHLDDERVVQR